MAAWPARPPLPIESKRSLNREAVAARRFRKDQSCDLHRGREPILVPAIRVDGQLGAILPDSAYRWTQWYVAARYRDMVAGDSEKG